jgi:uncharacterized protein with FMN-binding domain
MGTTATASTGGFASPTDSASPVAQATASATPDPVATSEVAAGTSAGSETTNTAPKPAASSSASASPSASATKATTAAAAISKTGDAIESGFGPVQVKVTKVSGKITDITYVQSVATHGRAAAFPYLVNYAIQANGSNFGNLSGATFTTNAFKQALESALAKF